MINSFKILVLDFLHLNESTNFADDDLYYVLLLFMQLL